MRLNQVRTLEELLALIEELGFLPFFKNSIEGFSVEDCCPPELWFADDADGPWEWKGPIAKSGKCIYGKFFNGKAGFVSRAWMPDFVNDRRDGYDFDARFDDELASYKDKALFDTIAQRELILSTDLKKLLNYRQGGNTGFDTVITRLQMQGYVCVGDFVYRTDKFGKPYGWGIAQYTTPEVVFGYEEVTSAYRKEPEESREKMVAYLAEVLADASEEQVRKLLKA